MRIQEDIFYIIIQALADIGKNKRALLFVVLFWFTRCFLIFR